jgi:hypothetical protein
VSTAAWSGFARPVAALAVLAVIPILVTSSEGQLKELTDRFLNGCVFVLHKELARAGHVIVSGHLAGTPPSRLPLTFEGRNGVLINTVEFEAAYRDGTDDDPSDLAFHPSTGKICPGTLCELTSPNRPVMTVVLTDLRPELGYRFRVRLLPAPPAVKLTQLSDVRAYVIFDAGLPGGICRVQPRRWFNFWVWASPSTKALVFLLTVVLGGLVMRWART